MTKTTHTPGPWKAYNSIGGRNLKHWAVGGAVDRIATIHDLGKAEYAYANAKLLAAAPDLKRVLTALLAQIDGEYLVLKTGDGTASFAQSVLAENARKILSTL